MKKVSLLLAAGLLAAGLATVTFADATIGSKAPPLTLTDINGKQQSLAEYKGKYVVLEWMNLGCPFVRKHYDSGNMQATQKKATDKGVVWLSICSSARGKQGNFTPAEWRKAYAKEKMNSTAVLLDPTGEVGKAYGAKTTPSLFVINPDGNLIYKGAIDDKPTTDKADIPGAHNYVLSALDEAMSGQPVAVPATQSYGCSVKYE